MGKPSTKRDQFVAGTGGKFLEGDVEITSLRVDFTDPEVYKREGRGIRTPAVFMGITVEGAEDEQEIILTTGKAKVKPAPDKKSFDTIDGDASFHESCAWAQMLASLYDCGMVPNDDLDDNYTMLVGLKGHLKRSVIDRPGLEKAKDKVTGKEIDFTALGFTVVTEWPEGLGGEPPKGKGKAKTSASATGSSTTSASNNGIDKEAIKVLCLIMGREDQEAIAKADLSTEVFDYIEKSAKALVPNRSKIIRRINDPDFLKTEQGWSFDGTEVSPAG